MLEFFANGQQQDADNYNSNKGIGFPGEFFFQENTGKQQRNNTNRRNNRCCNCAVAAQSVHICKLTGGFEYGSQNLILVLRNRAELYLFGLHEEEQNQTKQCKGQLVAGIGHIFDGFFGDAYQRSACEVIQIEDVNEGTECVQQSIDEGHAESNDGELLTKILFL